MIALSPTDGYWFRFLRAHPNIKVVNFWTPTPWKIANLSKGDHWYFVLKGHLPRKIGGGGTFINYRTIPASEAWQLYGQGHGCSSVEEPGSTLNSFISKGPAASQASPNPVIGCVLLQDCIFLRDSVQKTDKEFGVPLPAQVVMYKTYDREPLPLD